MTYATVEMLRDWMGVQGQVQNADLPGAGLVLAATDRAIDAYCGRTFAVASTDIEDATARIYAGNCGRCYIDDHTAVVSVEVSANRVTWTEVDGWWSGPDNADVSTFVESDTPFGRWVRVTALWGWPAVPAEVEPAALLKAARLWKRRDTPTGVEGFGDFVVRISRSEDADVAALLAPLRRGDRMGVA